MTHKITVTVTEPEGRQHAVDLDVCAVDSDSALLRVFGWYDYRTWLDQEKGQ